MKSSLLAAIFACAAAAQGGGLLEVHAESAAGAPTAQAWVLPGTGGQAETILLDSAILLDESAVASAAAESGPDGSPQLRLVLTPEGAGTLARITARQAGRRLGIVLAGRLRAAPFVRGAVSDGVLLVAGNLTRVEAEQLAARLAPPAPAALAAQHASESDEAVFGELEGAWRVGSATMNGVPVGDTKLTLATFSFRKGELALTNGSGQTERFSLLLEPGPPQALRLEPVAPSKERGGWMIVVREGGRLTLVFYDNLEKRPESIDPEPKKIVLKLERRRN
jgi:SecD-like export protein